MSRYFQAGDLSLWNPSNGVALVLVDRAGRDLPSLRTPAAPHLTDVSLGTGGIRPLGDPGRLLRLAEEDAAAMPR
jgi:hypothetical protein